MTSKSGRLIDADALIKDMEQCCSATQFGRRTAKMCIKRAPTIDAVPVVRCGECVFAKDDTDYCKNAGRIYCSRAGIDLLTRKHDFCSYGERRDMMHDK